MAIPVVPVPASASQSNMLEAMTDVHVSGVTAILFRRQRAMIPPPPVNDALPSDPTKTAANPQAVATAIANADSLGFTLHPSLVASLLHAHPADVQHFHEDMVALIRSSLGADCTFTPMYPNFPEQVLELPTAQLLLNALLHYTGDLVNLRITPLYSTTPRPSLMGGTPRHVLRSATVDDALKLLTSLLRQSTAWSATDRKDATTLLRWADARGTAPTVTEVPNRENLAVLISTTATSTSLGPLEPLITTVTDVLRTAVALSDGDVSLATRLWFRTFSRPLRRSFLATINRIAARDPDTAAEDMGRHAGPWISLGEKLHPGDYAERFRHANALFHDLRENTAPPGFNARVELLIREGDLCGDGGTLDILSSRPSEFARRLDQLLRVVDAEEQGTVVHRFAQLSQEVSTRVLLQVRGHFVRRAQKSHGRPRIFTPKGGSSTPWVAPDHRTDLDEGICQTIADVVREALEDRFSELPPLGNVWISPDIRGMTVPLALRNTLASLRTLGKGSRIPFTDKGTVRLFLWWHDNPGERTDLDLSAVAFSDSMEELGTAAYYDLNGLPGRSTHSGDLTSAPTGASEFIDLDLAALRSAGVRYVQMTVQNYTRQPLSNLTGAFAGFMAREEPQSGEIFEPTTVENRFDLESPAMNITPMVFDIAERTIIWMGTPLSMQPHRPNNVAANITAIRRQTEALLSPEVPLLHDLFSMHARARGTIVRSREDADTVFAVDGDVSPFDSATVLGDFVG